MPRPNRHKLHFGRHQLAMLLVVSLCGCGSSGPFASRDQSSESISNLGIDAVPSLRKLPRVSQVVRHGANGQPTHRIVHIADWHFVERDAYAADLRSFTRKPLTDEQIDREYSNFLESVDRVQQQQMALLRALVKEHGINRFHIEGLSERDQSIFEAKVKAIRQVGEELAAAQADRDELVASGQDVTALTATIGEVGVQHRRDLLSLGGLGQLCMAGEVEAALPLEDADAHRASNPVRGGTVVLDQEPIEVREDAIVRLLLNTGPFAIIVLGAGHDLADNVRRLSGGEAEYIRVEIEAVKRIGADGD